jgi:hypothetical protein
VHQQPDKKASRTFVFLILHQEKANKVFGKRFSRNCSQNFVTARLPIRSKGAASRRHLRRANRSLPLPLIDVSDSDQDDLSFAFENLYITLSSTSTSSKYYSCNLFFLFCLISMFNLCLLVIVFREVGFPEYLRTMCGSRTGGWSLPCVMSN